MPESHPIQCRCGQLRGLLQPTRPSNRCVCHCSDCQAFARHVGSPDTLDSRGGTDIVQVPASHFTFTQGREQLACIRLTDKGMLRWYASCCRTPIGNTLADRKADFVGLIHAGLGPGRPSLDESFGPVRMRVGVDGAPGADKPKAAGVFTGMAKVLSFIVKGRLRGTWRASPFFDPQTDLPIAQPQVLSTQELAAAKRRG
ncbi:hypothetical protein J2X20_002157 [Pelomonas saccharophila]|jgi:hypothetical protein|uniref:CENP-V/GFA domain-containing protein n=1 Tax=Roseateles saccharophilus TaxID=304 RepID=A0ABU1YKZ1_ROSSA|nr:DUF6151 family protein [Roseateles saccharophilus]MDR7269528.1 hypothetical protein [Roseateles saccharophilus]